MKLYKYIKQIYLEDFVKKGNLLFRNLSYFRKYEDKVRGDPYEGYHYDSLGAIKGIRNISKGNFLNGNFQIFHHIDSDPVFIFCLSEVFDLQLAKEFEANAIVEISNPIEFFRRIRRQIVPKASIHKAGVLAEKVIYYDSSQSPNFNIEDPKIIPFIKSNEYSYQNEFRIVFGKRNAFKLERLVSLKRYNPYIDLMFKNQSNQLIKIGNISDITNVIYLD